MFKHVGCRIHRSRKMLIRAENDIQTSYVFELVQCQKLCLIVLHNCILNICICNMDSLNNKTQLYFTSDESTCVVSTLMFT